jgi:hypothetical protein
MSKTVALINREQDISQKSLRRRNEKTIPAVIGNRGFRHRINNKRLSTISTDRILQIRSVGVANRTQLILANHSNAGKGQTPKLVFQKYGERYFLSQIFLNSEWAYSITPARCQRESEKNLVSRF